jgi:hypothetical protein
MIGDFFESFGKEKDEQRGLPQEVVDILNAALPDCFEYVAVENGNYRAVPRADKVLQGDMILSTQIDWDKVPELRDKLRVIPREKWDEYLYRTQTKVPITNVQIGDGKKHVPIEDLSADPLHSDEVAFIDTTMSPRSFPNPIKMTFESPENDVVEMLFQQQPYDSFTEVKFMNVDFPALKVELFQYSPLVDKQDDCAHTNEGSQLAATYSATPSKAETVKDAVAALRILRGFFNGKTKVNGKPITPADNTDEVALAEIEDALNLWESILKLEEKLGVSFNPDAEFPNEDVQLFTELQTCLLEGKAVLWHHPFDHFHIGGFHPAQEGVSFEDYIGNESIRYEFREGPIPATLLGAEFNLYRRTEMKDFVITNVEWDDDTKEKAEVYISDVPGKQWTLTRLYMTEADALSNS